jgi:hypothetical protein
MSTSPRDRARKAFSVGLIVLIVSFAALFLPLLIRLGQNAKFVVAPALIGAFLGLGVLLNATIDLLRGK